MPFDPTKSQPLIATDPTKPTLQFLKTPTNGSRSIGAIIALLGCLTPFVIFAYFGFNVFFAADLFPNSLHGNFADGTIIPAGPNAGKLFFIMDDSFYFTSEVSSPGSHSIRLESLFNKTYSYVYDGTKGEVLQRTKKTYDEGTPKFYVFTLGDSIWSVGESYREGKPDLHVVDTNTNEETMNLASFTKKFDQLKSGILNLQYSDEVLFFKHMDIKTLDGRNFQYYPDFDQLFESNNDLNKWLDVEKHEYMSQPANGWVLDGSGRKELHQVSGVRAEVMARVLSQSIGSYIDYDYEPELGNGPSDERLQFSAKIIGEGQVFINGEILYQDNDIVLILHQEDARDLSPKLISLAAKDKGIIWTVKEDKLVTGMRTRADNSFSSMFFVKDNFSAERVKESILVKYEQGGMVSFDIMTGNILMTFDPNKGWF
jgi:hypothetical protein